MVPSQSPTPPRSRRRWSRVLARFGVGLAALVAIWVTLALHPQPLFAFSVQRANVVVHARTPLPPEAGPILDDVVRRISRSPIYDSGRTHNVFLCDSPLLFAVFAPDAGNARGVAHTHLGGNAFIRSANVARNRVVGASGREASGERTLAYFIAHEVTHAMTARRTGRLNYARLAAFQQEGYADYVAFDHRVDLAAGREALRRNEPEMDTRRSGLYRRQELLVAFLLERQGMTVDALLAAPLDRRDVEHQLEIARDL